MRALLALVALGLLVGCAARPAATPVYRYINVGDGEQRLGEPLTADANQVGEDLFQLRPGSYSGGGTSAIFARVDDRRRVTSLLFVYDGTDPYDSKVRSYTEDLGEPFEMREGADGSRLHVWQDERTRFELHLEPSGEVKFWSVLFDLEADLPQSGFDL